MVRGLITGNDGADILVRGPSWDAPVKPGGVLSEVTGGAAVTGLPFGVVEIAVVAGLGAGAVHRLEVGRYRCGPGDDADLVLPAAHPWTVEVRPGGQVLLGDGTPWPVGQRRTVAGLDLQLRWCAGPSSAAEPVSTRGRGLADLLLDRVGGRPMLESDPVWELGRLGGTPVEVPVVRRPLVVLTGAERRSLARSLLGRLLVGCGATQVRLTVFAPGAGADTRAEWAWVRWLPHSRCPDERFVRVGFDDETCAGLVEDIALRRRTDDLLDVVVVDGHVGAVEELVRPGFAVLVLDDDPSGGLVVDVPGPRATVKGLSGDPVEIDVDLPGHAWADRLARTLTTTDEEDVPPGRLVDLLGIGPSDDDGLIRRWSAPATTRVPIGRADDDTPVYVDLRSDGPHALIGGTTGSGKSELLQTLVTSLAVANPPESMTFLLVDYKGGAAFTACDRLPHTLGVVTDLDAGLTGRALASLSAEVHRREHLLAAVGAVDIDAYLASGHGPLARLVIVVDEFATLAAELPDFVDGLVDIARRGRSLGLHLVLATQRPAGAVSADIRANTTLRIALRVAEAADSVDVIGVPDAVAIDERRPGRAFVRVGQNPPVEVRIARVTTSGPPAATVQVPYVFGEPVGRGTSADSRASSGSDLAELATTMTRVVAALDASIPPSPWLPPLPGRVDLTDCDRIVAGGSGIPFGLEDRPEQQRRDVAALPLDGSMPLAVIGTVRSGRTAVLRALAASVAVRFSPADVHVHAIDAGAHGLAGLEELPNVGVVAGRDDSGRMGRLVARLAGELDARLQKLALRRLRDIAEQRETEPDDPWPYLVVLVDRWDLLADTSEAGGDRLLMASLERLATEGGRTGIVVVATGDRTMLTGRMTSVFPDRLVLRLADVYDYTTIGLPGPAGHAEPGRGWRGAAAVETQVADTDALIQGLIAGEIRPAGAAAGGRDAVRRGPFRIDPLPGFVTRGDIEALPRPAHVTPGSLLVAAGGDELGARWIDADEFGPCALVTGRRRTGRSGVLMMLAESALAAGWEVAVVTARRSPLEMLPGIAPGRVHGPFRREDDSRPLADVVDRCLARRARLLVLADDVDLMPDGPLLDVLGGLPASLRDTGCLFVGSGEAEEIVAAFRGPAPALRRSRCGVMLSPQVVDDGEAFGVRLRRGQYGQALGVGGGYLVLDGMPERVQVVRSSYLPEP